MSEGFKDWKVVSMIRMNGKIESTLAMECETVKEAMDAGSLPLCDLGQIMQGVADRMSAIAGPERPVRLRLPAEPLCVWALPHKLERAMMALADFALEMGEACAGVNIAAVVCGSGPASRIVLRFAPGLPLIGGPVSELQEGILRASLAEARAILEDVEGRLDVRKAGDGPIAVEAVLPRPMPSFGQELGKHGRAILVVEDDTAIRRLLVEVLSAEGYRTESVAEGSLAVRILEEDPGIEMVITDLVMPGMHGLDLAEWVSSTRPDIRVVCMSGHPRDHYDRLRKLLDRRLVSYLPKPFLPNDVKHLVKRLLKRG